MQTKNEMVDYIKINKQVEKEYFKIINKTEEKVHKAIYDYFKGQQPKIYSCIVGALELNEICRTVTEFIIFNKKCKKEILKQQQLTMLRKCRIPKDVINYIICLYL